MVFSCSIRGMAYNIRRIRCKLALLLGIHIYSYIIEIEFSCLLLAEFFCDAVDSVSVMIDVDMRDRHWFNFSLVKSS